MTNPSLYALIRCVLWTLAAVMGAAGASSAQPADVQPVAVPCAACIVPSATPGQTLALPGRLNGLEVLVRIPSGASENVGAALAAISRAGGVAGLHVIGGPTEIDQATLEAVSRVLVDVSMLPNTDADSLAFQLKKTLTALRARAGQLKLGVVLTPLQASELLARDLAPYVDVIVGTGDAVVKAGVEVWGTVELPASDAAALLRAAGARTVTHGRLLWRMPDDVIRSAQLLADLAASAPFLPPGLVPVTDPQLFCGGRPLESFLNPETLDTVALAEQCAATDAITGGLDGQVAERVILSSGTSIVRLAAAQDRVAEGAQVTAALLQSLEVRFAVIVLHDHFTI